MNIVLMAILAAGVIGPLDHNIVTTEWLAQHLDDPNVILVEVGAAQPVDHAHIPGARFLAIESLKSPEEWPPDELPPVDQLRQAFANAGIGDDGRIILYSANPLNATRAWFTLDYLGQGDRTAILDGGFTQWLREKRTISGTRYPHLPKTFTPRPDPNRVISHAEMRNVVDRADSKMLDARPAKEFHGFNRGKGVVRRGHIPGAMCEPWPTNLTSSGTFRTPQQLRAEYQKLLGDPNDERVIVYCRTGMEATMPYFVLRSLGYNVVLYDGSFTEWSRDKNAPVAKLSTRR